METINDRMEMLVNSRFDGNKAAFAKSIGLQPTGLSNYLGNKRRSKPSVDMVVKIVENLNVDAYWLLTGKDNKEGNTATANGKQSVAAINSSITVAENTAVLKERVKSLEALLAEKERLIKVYEKMIEK
ncbi:MAG: helix-turn-helix domain-containing protein [Prevotella sp.]|nr:helix-turn-helix domain-containing protein [Prevotella sp.]